MTRKRVRGRHSMIKKFLILILKTKIFVLANGLTRKTFSNGRKLFII